MSSGNPQQDSGGNYAEDDSEEKGLTEEEFNQPVPPVDPEEEEMSLLKAVAFLGFGMAALAIIFILFFIRDLGNKVGDVDAAVNTLEERFGPLKTQVETGFAQLNQDVGQLKEKVGNYEKMIAIMELKRAKVAIQEATANAAPEIQARSSQVISHIDNMLADLGAGEAGAAPVSPAMAPAAPAPAETPVEEPAAGTVEEEPLTGLIQLESETEEPAAEPASAPEAESETTEDEEAAEAEDGGEEASEEAPGEAEEAGEEGDEEDEEEDE